MGFFPETNYDFPNVSQYDGDLREVLEMYEKVTKDYAFLAQSQSELNAMWHELLLKAKDLDKREKKLSKKLESYIGENDKKLDDFIKLTENNFKSLRADVTLIDRMVEQINENLMHEIRSVKTYSDLQNEILLAAFSEDLTDLDNRIQAQFEELKFKLPDVYNPARGIETDVQTVINDFWKWLRYGAYTAQEFDTSGWTAAELDAVGATAVEWDVNGKIILKGDKPNEENE